jgi:hypothetical protein
VTIRDTSASLLPDAGLDDKARLSGTHPTDLSRAARSSEGLANYSIGRMATERLVARGGGERSREAAGARPGLAS